MSSVRAFSWRKLHMPSIEVVGLLVGGVLRVVAFMLRWPVWLVIISEISLLMALGWILIYDLFPIFLQPFYFMRERFRRRNSFFVALIVFFIAMQAISYFLPSGRTKDITTTLAFLSFASSIVWFVGVNFVTLFTPIIKYIKHRPRDVERITFADVVTSMAIIITPTVALSFFFSPPGLGRYEVTPYQVFLTSLLTNITMALYLYLLVIRPKIFTWRQLGLRKVIREDIGKAFVQFVLVAIIMFILQTLILRLGFSLQSVSFSSKEGAILALIVLIGVTPIVEELYFRGFLFQGLLLHNKPWIAYVVSSLMFALLHPPLIVMMEVFIIGLLLAYIVQSTKSIWPTVFIHALNNLLVFGYLLYK